MYSWAISRHILPPILPASLCKNYHGAVHYPETPNQYLWIEAQNLAVLGPFSRETIYVDHPIVLFYPMVDMFVSVVKSVGPGTHMYNGNLCRKYWQIPIDPGDVPYLWYHMNISVYTLM